MDRYQDAIYCPITGHSSPGSLADKKMIVLHITEGFTAAGAINTFRTSVAPHRVSAHFVIDRDLGGTTYQLLDLSAVAWHASEVNHSSIGIEHVALSQAGADRLNALRAKDIAEGKTPYSALPCTEAQYQASAALIAWLCGQLNIPCDRAHIRTHNEASPRDGHTLCCTGGLDPDKLVQMAAEQTTTTKQGEL